MVILKNKYEIFFSFSKIKKIPLNFIASIKLREQPNTDEKFSMNKKIVKKTLWVEKKILFTLNVKYGRIQSFCSLWITECTFLFQIISENVKLFFFAPTDFSFQMLTKK